MVKLKQMLCPVKFLQFRDYFLSLKRCMKEHACKCNGASSRENLSSGFPTRVDSNRPAQLQKLAGVLKFGFSKYRYYTI